MTTGAAGVDPARLVFVGGLHRSGTTPLARALAEHPDVSGLSGTGVKEDEGQHLQDVYPKAKVHGGSGRFAFDPRSHLTEDSPLVTGDAAARMLQSWMPFWDMESRVLVEKSPPNLVMGRFLQACFPGSASVVIVRHPVAVALSNKKWRRLSSGDPRKFQSLSRLVEHWFVAHDTYLLDQPHLSRHVLVHYEDLVGDPEASLVPVADLLGLTTPVPAGSLSGSHGSGYQQWWDELEQWWRPGSWQRRTIERRYADRMARWGYDPQDLGTHHHEATGGRRPASTNP